MAIKENTIVMHSTKLCKFKIGTSDAHYHDTKPYRICINQKFLKQQIGIFRLFDEKNGDVIHTGNWSIAALMAHELAHHGTISHNKGFIKKFYRFKAALAIGFISGQLIH